MRRRPGPVTRLTRTSEVAFLRSGLEYTDAYVAFFRIAREHEASGGGRLPEQTRQRIRVALDQQLARVARHLSERPSRGQRGDGRVG